MRLEQFSQMLGGSKTAADIAAAVAMAPGSEIGYWIIRARVIGCDRAKYALFFLLVDLLKESTGAVIAAKLAGVIIDEALDPKICKTCHGDRKAEINIIHRDGTKSRANVPCPACSGLGWHWLGERVIADRLGLTRHQVRLGGYTETIREWASVLITLGEEKSKQTRLS